jgi:hypothetical protein
MSEHGHVGLSDLPQFTIQAVRREGTELSGVFDQLRSVQNGRAWLYRPHGESLESELVSVNADTRVAVMQVPRESLPLNVQTGSTFPYFYGYFEPRDVDMILDPH